MKIHSMTGLKTAVVNASIS